MKPILALVALVMVGAAADAQIPAVDSARAGGLVGERYDGFVGIAAPVPANVRSQVAAINVTRRTLYARLAGQRGASPQDVGITAGCELLARVAVGQAYLWPDAQWRRRAAGQGAPVPDYCR